MLLKLTLYTRPDCFLCDKMKAAIRHVADNIPLSLEEIDIDTSPELTARYGRDIPVLLVEGHEIARHRVTTDALRKMLGERTAGHPRL